VAHAYKPMIIFSYSKPLKYRYGKILCTAHAFSGTHTESGNGQDIQLWTLLQRPCEQKEVQV
jgi:hypothetical protein